MCVIPRQLTTFKGAAKAIKLFAKHIKVMAMVEYNEHLNCAQRHVFSAVCLLSVQIEEQVKLLQKGVTHIGVGTPARINALIEKGRCGDEYVTVKLKSIWCLWKNLICFVFFLSAEGLSLRALRYLVLDWNWRDQKLRRMADIPEVSHCCPLLA